ncbi:MAG: hypothetical protein DRJ03_15370 [Chloroflexi bacterium]|nr:MAG: hypothetical protein DRJ03_15370 [Chloroflexota bacterium]
MLNGRGGAQKLIHSGIKSITSTGESLYLGQTTFLPLAGMTKTHGLKVGIFTNGILINERLAGDLVGCMDEVAISLDGPTEEVNDEIRGIKGSFKRTINGIMELRI